MALEIIAIHSDMMDVKNVCFLFHFPFLKSNRYHIEIPMRLRSTCYHNSIQKTNPLHADSVGSFLSVSAHLLLIRLCLYLWCFWFFCLSVQACSVWVIFVYSDSKIEPQCYQSQRSTKTSPSSVSTFGLSSQAAVVCTFSLVPLTSDCLDCGACLQTSCQTKPFSKTN